VACSLRTVRGSRMRAARAAVRRIGRVTVLGCVLATSLAGVASAQEFDQGSTPETASGPLARGQSYTGVLAPLGDVDVFTISVPTSPSFLRVTLSRTNRRCEVWATLRDRFGTELTTSYVPSAGVSLVTDFVGEDTYYVSLDTGPIRQCVGATYSLEYLVQPLLIESALAPRTSLQSRCDSRCALPLCEFYCKRVSKTATQIRLIRHAIHASTSTPRRSLRKALVRVTKAHRRYRRLESIWCRRAGAGA
jgi:hypothetical protein